MSYKEDNNLLLLWRQKLETYVFVWFSKTAPVKYKILRNNRFQIEGLQEFGISFPNDGPDYPYIKKINVKIRKAHSGDVKDFTESLADDDRKLKLEGEAIKLANDDILVTSLLLNCFNLLINWLLTKLKF